MKITDILKQLVSGLNPWTPAGALEEHHPVTLVASCDGTQESPTNVIELPRQQQRQKDTMPTGAACSTDYKLEMRWHLTNKGERVCTWKVIKPGDDDTDGDGTAPIFPNAA